MEPKAEAEVGVRVDMNVHEVQIIDPECVLREYMDVHWAEYGAVPKPGAAASFNNITRRNMGGPCQLAIRARLAACAPLFRRLAI